VGQKSAFHPIDLDLFEVIIGLEIWRAEQPLHFQMVESSEDKDGGRYRIRTYDFHRVNESRQL
jgi:hypothetical protein